LPHYPVQPEFQQISYAQRHEIFCERLVRERLYDATCFLMSSAKAGLHRKYTEPREELCFRNFAASLSARFGVCYLDKIKPRQEIPMPEIEDQEEFIETGSGEDEPGDLPVLEKKYQKQMRQIVTQKLDLPVSALLTMLKEQIKLNPEFQRRDRWNESRQSRLIESLVMNVPIPPVFLGEDEYGHYIVLDGRQRLTSVAKFLNNELVLKDLDVWDELNGKNFQELVKRGMERYLTRRFIPAVVILKESSAVVKYDVFDRLNTGGIPANDMEIRNAVYRGLFTETLHNLSRTPDFCRLWNIPQDIIEAEARSKMYQQMEDLGLVLRFFALYEYQSMTLRFKDYLSVFMDERNKAYVQNPAQKTEDEQRFLYAVKNCWRIFGEGTFRKPNGKRSFPLADAVMVALSGYPPETITEPKAGAVRTALQTLFENKDFLHAIDKGTNGRGAITTRIERATHALATALA
jgi:hypothetical protein